jgi:hypothetical protein
VLGTNLQYALLVDYMSSNKSGEGLAVLQSKVAQLEAKQKTQCMGQKMKELMKALEKRIQEIEKKEMETKFEKMQAALENERRDKLFERRDRSLEGERIERQVEKKEMMAALEKKEMMAALENERRDREAALENEKRDRVLEDERRERQAEKKEMMAALEKTEREHQHQIDQLKSEARISQMEQQLLQQQATYTNQGISITQPTIQHTAIVDPVPQRETELLLLQRIQRMELTVKEKERELLPKKEAFIQPISIPNEDITPLQAPDASHKTTTLQLIPHKSAVVPQASKNSSHRPKGPSATIITPSQQQHQVAAALPQGTTNTGKGGAVPLPGDSRTHFFLSHCQSTGGDQTNAIYLELRQLGFNCWYDNRADDLTKEGMRQGILHAAAFLLFLSKGILDRPFCKY